MIINWVFFLKMCCPKSLGIFQSKVLNNQSIISSKSVNKIGLKINVTYSENKSLVDCTKNYVRIVREIVWYFGRDNSA